MFDYLFIHYICSRNMLISVEKLSNCFPKLCMSEAIGWSVRIISFQVHRVLWVEMVLVKGGSSWISFGLIWICVF